MDRALKDILKGTSESFRPYYELSDEADALTVYFRPDADYSKRLTDHLTLYLSLDTDEVVGCRIKGIAAILEDLPNYISASHAGVKLSVIFWSFRGAIGNDMRHKFNELAAATRELELEVA